MNQEDFTNAFILLLSSATELKGKEIKWEDEYDDGDIYIEFPDLTPTHAIVRKYWSNGNKYYEYEYMDGKLNGRYLLCAENGNKLLEHEYKNGVKIK